MFQTYTYFDYVYCTLQSSELLNIWNYSYFKTYNNNNNNNNNSNNSNNSNKQQATCPLYFHLESYNWNLHQTCFSTCSSFPFSYFSYPPFCSHMTGREFLACHRHQPLERGNVVNTLMEGQAFGGFLAVWNQWLFLVPLIGGRWYVYIYIYL